MVVPLTSFFGQNLFRVSNNSNGFHLELSSLFQVILTVFNNELDMMNVKSELKTIKKYSSLKKQIISEGRKSLNGYKLSTFLYCG